MALNITLLGKLHTTLIFTLGFTFVCGCGDKESEEKPAAPIVGAYDLPVSKRNDAKPAGDFVIEVSSNALQANGEKLLDLENGKFKKADVKAGTLPALAAKLNVGSPVVLKMASLVRFQSLIDVLKTLVSKNVSRVDIGVNTGSGADVGYMTIENFTVLDRKEAVPESLYVWAWDDILEQWDDFQSACQSGDSVDCDSRAKNAKKGGRALMTLFAKDAALRLQFERYAAPEEIAADEAAEAEAKEAEKAALAKAAKAKKAGKVTDLFEVYMKPQQAAHFTWQFSAALKTPSPISTALRPNCGAKKCTALLQVGRFDTVARAFTFLGAAFPNGTPSPDLTIQAH